MPPGKKAINDERALGKSRRTKYEDGSKESIESSQHRKKRDDGDRRAKEDGRKDHDRDGRDKSDRHREKDYDKNSDDRDTKREREHRDRQSGKDDDPRDSERRRKDDKEKRDGNDRERRHQDENHDRGNRDERERRHREDDRDRKHRENEKKDSDRRHRDDKDRRRNENEERDSKYKDDKGTRHRDSEDREKRHRDDGDRERRHRNDGDGERKHREDGDKERRHRDDRDRERKHRDDGDKERRHKDDGDGERRRRDDGDRERRHKDDGDREKRHRDDVDKDRRHRDDGDKERKHKEDVDKERRHREDGDRDRRHRDDSDRERRRKGDDTQEKHKDDDRDRKRKDDDGERRQRDMNEKESETKYRNGRDSKGGNSVDKERGHRADREKDYRDDKDRRHGEGSRKQKEYRSDKDGREYDEDNQSTSSANRKKTAVENGSSQRNSGRKVVAHRQGEVEEEGIEFESAEAAKKSAPEPTDDGDGDDNGGYDDDDFEDYDDDFEDDDGADEAERFNKMSNNEMEELFDALNAENERLLSGSRKSDWSDGATESSDERQPSHGRPNTSKPRGFINFVAAKQRDMNQKAASKARKRCTELLNIVELDTVHMSLFDLPPVKEYDLYMSSFGRTNAQQVYIQTNEDNLERDTQTEEIDITSRWTQHPAEGATACGQPDKDGSSGQDALDKTAKHDDGKLSSFLQRTCQVIERLINEEHAKSSYSERSSSFSCSEAHTNLSNVGIFEARQATRSCFSPTDSSMLLTMHTEPTQMVDKRLDTYGLIGVWKTHDPSQPQKIVASASMPTCCCFSPIKATLVFGGMRDGSVVAWDLREPPTMHHSYICGGQDWLLRFPTYNTAGVLKYENHNSPVTALVPILTDSSKSSSQESGLGLSFQLASLERNGIVNLWVVAEILETSMAGSESDLGLSPNGKIKLLKSSSISLTGPSRSLCTLDLKLNPSNHNHFYVATDGGMVLHSTRFGTQKTIPRCYKCDDSTPCVITTVDLHPYGHPVLLAGCEDGSIRLHHLSSETPAVVWESSTSGAAVTRVLWSKNCAYIIFVLDSNSIIHMWDLLRNDAEPMTSDQLSEGNKKVIDMSLSAEEQSNSRPKMVLNYSDGTVQVHLLSSHVSNLQPGEHEQFTRFVEQL